MEDAEKYIEAEVQKIWKNADGDVLKSFKQYLPMISDMCSRAALEALRSHMCLIHERCDGTCVHARASGEDLEVHVGSDQDHCDEGCKPIRISYQPLSFGPVQLPDIPIPYRKIKDDRAVPYDIAWLEVQDLADFQYTPLSTDRPAIRLLKVQKGVFRDDVLQCTLETVYLDEGVAYWALSYQWGAPIFDQKISCNGQSLLVTKSLVEALKGFRQCCDGEVLQDLIWVDAVCINQKDTSELNAQIGLMQDIYSNAEGVFTYLGDIDESWYPGFDLMHRVSTIVSYFNGSVRFKFPRDELLENFGFPPIDHPAWRTLTGIFASPWFTRTWIIQELTFAKQALVRFGKFTFWWDILDCTWRFMITNGIMEYAWHLDSEQKAALGVNNMANLLWFRNKRVRGTLKDVPMMETLMKAKDFDVSNPKDKIIAILGLLQIQHSTPLNYSLSTAELYKQFAIHVIEQDMGRDLILFGGLSRQSPTLSPDMPSWVPDWTMQSLNSQCKHIFRLRLRAYRAGGNPNVPNSIINAPVGSPMEGKTIAAAMCIVSHITQVTNSACEASSPMAFIPWHNEARALFENACAGVHVKYENPEDAFCNTITACSTHRPRYSGVKADNEESPPTLPEKYLAALASIRRDFLAAQEETATVPDLPEDNKLGHGFKVQCLTTCSGRKLAILADGRIGVVPACTKVGDSITVIMGLSIPLVIRPTRYRSEWQLVGDCYVHGIMEGEMVDDPRCDVQMTKIS